MKGKEWDEPKLAERHKLEKLNAWEVVTADDPRIKGMKVVDTMWVGRCKRDGKGEISKYNARMVMRGDQHVNFYNITPNDCAAPVVRNCTMMCAEAICCVREQSFWPYDVSGAYLQGKQKACERTVVAVEPSGESGRVTSGVASPPHRHPAQRAARVVVARGEGDGRRRALAPARPARAYPSEEPLAAASRHVVRAHRGDGVAA